MHDIIKSVATPQEAIKIFSQLRHLLSQRGFELKKWVSNSDKVAEAIPVDLKSVINAKQIEVETNTEASAFLGLHCPVTDDSVQVCRNTNK